MTPEVAVETYFRGYVSERRGSMTYLSINRIAIKRESAALLERIAALSAADLVNIRTLRESLQRVVADRL